MFCSHFFCLFLVWQLRITTIITEVRKFVVESYNSTFFGTNKSCSITMVYALMNLLGPSSKNQEWSLTEKFGAYLKRVVGEERNHLQDAHSSRFGKDPEFMVLIAYHYK